MFEGWLQLMQRSQQSWERCWCSDPGTSELGKGLGDGIRGFRLAITEVLSLRMPNSRNLKSVRGRQAPV
jgi:hypothetical protein